MKDKRFQFGVILTASWLGVMVGISIIGTRPEKLNEWGDFFAGFFAPLAFLWLVIGYLQQGDELRQSTEALRLQAAELRNSVEQQSQLVEISRKQLDQATVDSRVQHDLALRAQLPRFLVHMRIKAEYLHEKSVELQLENAGKIARKVVVTLDQPEGPTDVLRVELLQTERHATAMIRLPKNAILQGRIRCLDEVGIGRETSFQVIWDARGTLNTQPDPLPL